MAKSMTKSAIITHLSQKTTLSKKQVTDVMDQLATLATKEAKNVFVVPNFGRLVLANRKARMGRNPQTGRADQDPGQARRQVPSGEVAEGRGAWQEVARPLRSPTAR